MEDIMFKLFERQPNWTLRQLIQETDQPEVCFLLIYFLLNFYFFPFKIFMSDLLDVCLYVSEIHACTVIVSTYVFLRLIHIRTVSSLAYNMCIPS